VDELVLPAINALRMCARLPYATGRFEVARQHACVMATSCLDRPVRQRYVGAAGGAAGVPMLRPQ
jgi:hypothetical protein